MKNLGLVRAAAVTPVLKVANPEFNTEEIIRCMYEANSNGAGIILFPELCLSAYTCGDLFYQDLLYNKNLEGLRQIAEVTGKIASVVVLGFYLRIDNSLFNCAALIQGGKVRGIVPKMFLPNYKEFYEARWFSPGLTKANHVNSVRLFGYDVPFGHLIFEDESIDLKLGIEVCEDLWVPVPPGSYLALRGAHILLNPSSSDETVAKSEYRKNLVNMESARSICGYVYTSSGVHESTTDIVYSGHKIISENGLNLAESPLFERNSSILYGDIDYDRIKFERTHSRNFESSAAAFSTNIEYSKVALDPVRVLESGSDTLKRTYEKNPFVPSDPATVDKRCNEIFSIQSSGLAKRMEHTRSKKAVVGISGGLDSTLALLVCAETFKLIGKDPGDIIAVTMPGFGTTDKTYNNAQTIMRLLGVDQREISIRDAVLQHFKDIGHDPDQHDITYENSQARERTQILMDIANKEGGLVIGTGDLSEVALGWSTYNGDHMSMYGVNTSVPKTLVRFVIKWVMDYRLSGPSEEKNFSSDNALLKQTLQDIMDTPISPELLPPDAEGKIAQKTEDTVGPYILHDFFMYYTIRFGMQPRKLLYIAKTAFAGEYSEDFIKKWLITFYRRFFSQQFKRSCIPDGPKVGSVSLSPRGDWRMPSDADPAQWLKELEE
ncbi:NAD(+) synthase [Anoxybacterium hadale]|uniref:NAD(+) synthase n=1 Tax=Anoxybacterium hadale TaxID=3408580 RepID=A0ACD1AD05_9FIRM|nr:NAD(+) synthase [Clostridiales bacterium]